jgi:hypothetical protein
MNCGQFETRLNLLLDQRRPPAADPALAAHAAVCAACDDLLADHIALVACAARSPLPSPSSGFAGRVVTAASPQEVGERRTKKIVLALCVALSSAAAMLLAISIAWKARQATPGSDNPVLAEGRITSADVLVGAPGLWRKEFALAAGGASSQLDQVEKVAPVIRPWRHSLALIWDALRHAFQTKHDAITPPNEEQTGHWSIIALGIA